MNDIDKILRTAVFHELGIAPITDARFDFNRILSTLSPEDAKRAKRKFRKLWRTRAKKEKKGEKRFGLGAKEPTRAQKAARKSVVLMEVMGRVTLMKNAAGIKTKGHYPY